MFLLSLLLLALPALAFNPNVVDTVGQGFFSFGSIGAIDGYVEALWTSSTPLVYSIAIIAVAVSGAEMVISQSEDSTARARNAFIASVIGLIVLVLAQIIRNVILNIGAGGQPAAGILNDEILGVVDFFTSLAGIVIVLMLFINGIIAILQFGNGEGISILRRTIINIVIGIIIISIREVFVNSWYITQDPNPIVAAFIGYVNDVLVFIGVIAVLVIVYAGIMMIVNGGNEDQFTKARNLIVRAIIGLIIILLSGAIVNAIFDGVA